MAELYPNVDHVLLGNGKWASIMNLTESRVQAVALPKALRQLK